MSAKNIHKKELGKREKEGIYIAPRLEGKVKNVGIKNIKKKGKKG